MNPRLVLQIRRSTKDERLSLGLPGRVDASGLREVLTTAGFQEGDLVLLTLASGPGRGTVELRISAVNGEAAAEYIRERQDEIADLVRRRRTISHERRA